jgi:putative endopeptidase
LLLDLLSGLRLNYLLKIIAFVMNMKNTFRFLPLALMVLALSNCTQTPKEVVTLDLSNMDTTVSPGDDFFRFVNGAWYDNTEIPADEGRWGSFNELRKNNNETVLAVLEKAAGNKKYIAGSDERKAADFYAVGMDSALAEERGIEPLKPWLEKIEAIEDVASMQSVLEEMHVAGFPGFFGLGVFGDLMNSSINALYLAPNALGLPNRDYYTKEDSASVAIQKQYIAHVARMLAFMDDSKTDFMAEAKAVYAIEYQLALASLTPIERRNIPLLYNPMDIKGLEELTPSIDWNTYLANNSAEVADTVIVMQPKFMKEVEQVLLNTSMADIQEYLKWHLINRASPYLNAEVVQADFDFYGSVLRGTTENKPRWERVLGVTNGALGEALGKLYVDEVFPPEAKAEAEEMVKFIVLALEDRIDALEWMTDDTKKMAHEKLANFTVKIGYPNKWKDYSALVVENSGDAYSYFANRVNASVFMHMEDMAKIGEPVDKEEWNMNPQTVNAYYSPINNEIVFPAAILQPPFFYYGADPAINFGGIGAVIGHEITHGFDDQGSRFDADGNMVNWWTEEDKASFNDRADKLVAQWDAYEALPGLHIQGRLTLGENIADLGGVNLAYDGLQKYFETNEKPGEIGGFTQEQRFFLSWGTIWRTKMRDENLRTQVQTGPHSPGQYRAFGPLVNVDYFYDAFNVQEGDKLYLPVDQRVKIW